MCGTSAGEGVAVVKCVVFGQVKEWAVAECVVLVQVKEWAVVNMWYWCR